MALVEYVVSGVPRSGQRGGKRTTANLQRWRQKVAAAAHRRLPADFIPVSENVAYMKDYQVRDVRASRRSLDVIELIASVPPALAEGLTFGGDFVYVRIDDAPDPQVPYERW